MRTREREIDLEMQRKRKSDEAQVSGDSSKRPNVVDVKGKGQQVRGRCGKCDKMCDGACMVSGYGCFKCGRTWHISRDCATTATTTPVSDMIFFH